MRDDLINYIRAVAYVLHSWSNTPDNDSPLVADHFKRKISSSLYDIYGYSGEDVERIIDDAFSSYIMRKSLTPEDYASRKSFFSSKRGKNG